MSSLSYLHLFLTAEPVADDSAVCAGWSGRIIGVKSSACDLYIVLQAWTWRL